MKDTRTIANVPVIELLNVFGEPDTLLRKSTTATDELLVCENFALDRTNAQQLAVILQRWVDTGVLSSVPVAASTAPTATSRETSGEPETATASPAQFEQAVDEFERAIEQHEDAVDDAFLLEGDLTDRTPPSDNPRVTAASADLLAARAALLSLFSKAAGAPTRAEGETVEGAVESFRPGTDDLAHLADLRVHAICDSSPGWPVGTKVTVSRLVSIARNPPSAGGPPQ